MFYNYQGATLYNYKHFYYSDTKEFSLEEYIVLPTNGTFILGQDQVRYHLIQPQRLKRLIYITHNITLLIGHCRRSVRLLAGVQWFHRSVRRLGQTPCHGRHQEHGRVQRIHQ